MVAREQTAMNARPSEAIRVEGLNKTFKLSARQKRLRGGGQAVRRALDGLSFSVGQGEIYGLLGPNGAGKTTALRIIATLIQPDSGEAWVGGYNTNQEARLVRASIGFLTTDMRLDGFFTPDYLYDFYSKLYNVPPGVATKRKDAIFKRLSIGGFAATRIADLSTGMRQKVALAVSLAHDPEVIVFDEPTNGLDVITARVVTDLLQELREAGKAILLSTHDFSLVDKLCDRIGVIINGRIVAEGTVTEVTGGLGLEESFFNLYNMHGYDET